MPFAVKYDRKLKKWVTYNKVTGKIKGKFDSEEKARAQLGILKQWEDENGEKKA